MSVASKPVSYQFGDGFELCPATRELRQHGEVVPLECRTLELLIFLVENRERAVDRDELHKVIWDERPISETVMAHAVMKARRAVGDDGSHQALIKTIPGFGYRFVAEVAESLSSEGSSNTAAGAASADIRRSAGNGSGSRQLWYGLAAVLLVALVAVAVTLYRDDASNPGNKPLLAVLPVVNDTRDETLDWATLGLMGIIHQSMESLNHFDLVPSPSVMDVLDDADTEEHPAVDERGIYTERALAQVQDLAENSYLLAGALRRESDLFRLDYEIHGPGEDRWRESLVGPDAVSLAESVGYRISRRMMPERQLDIPDDLSDDPLVNETYARGIHAKLSGDFALARTMFDTCLELDSEVYRARFELGDIERRFGNWKRADELLTQARRAAHDAGDDVLSVQIYRALGQLERERGNLMAAESYVKRGLELASSFENGYARPMLEVEICRIHRHMGKFHNIERMLTQALDLARARGDRQLVAATLREFASYSMDTGRFDQAIEMATEALQTSRYLGREDAEVISLHDLGRVVLELWRTNEAEVYLSEAAINGWRLNYPWLINRIEIDLARMLAFKGQFDEAMSHLDEIFDRAAQDGDRWAMARVQQLRGEFHLEQDRLNEAETALRWSYDRFDELEYKVDSAATRLTMGHIYLAKGNLDTAAEIGRQIHEYASDNGNLGLQIQANRLSARVAEQRQNLQEALVLYTKSLAISRGMGNRRMTADLSVDYGLLCIRIGRMREADALLASLSDWNDYFRVLYFRARYQYEIGNYGEAMEALATAKELAGQRWSADNESLLVEYREAAESARSENRMGSI